jgi:hypothetical protein
MNWLPPQRTNWPPPPEKKKRRVVRNGRREGRFGKKRQMADKWDPSK